MNRQQIALRIHSAIYSRVQTLKRGYFRLLLNAPTLEIYFPCYISSIPNLSLGKNVAIGAFVHILSNARVRIGDNTIIASSVQITTSTHDYHIRAYRSHRDDAPISIGNNVWIGAGAIIFPGVTIGDNSVIGAGSLVNKDVPSDTLVVGTPARVVKRISAGAACAEPVSTLDQTSAPQA